MRMTFLALLICATGTAAYFAKARPQPGGETLTEARAAYSPNWRESTYEPDSPIPEPTGSDYVLTKYESDAGELVSLITPDPGDESRHPAVLWAHGGFGGLDPSYWAEQPATNDQTPQAFVDAGFVVMLPAWRGENDNPGRFEMFLGEVDDAVAAIDHLRSLRYVDPDRIYMVGHSSGGTLTLLTAMSTDKLRAAFSFGATWDMSELSGSPWEAIFPFEPSNEQALRVRSPFHFLPQLKTPTWDIEGARAANDRRLEALLIAGKHGVPLRTFVIQGGDHFDILRPATELLARKLMADTGEKLEVELTKEELQAAFDETHKERLAQRRGAPIVQLTPAAEQLLLAAMRQNEMKPASTWLVFGESIELSTEFDADTHVEIRQGTIRIAVPKDSVDHIRGTILDAVGGQFVFSNIDDQ